MSYTPPFLPPASPPKLAPPKKRHKVRNWAIAVGALVVVLGLISLTDAPSPRTVVSATATTNPVTNPAFGTYNPSATTIPATTIPATPAASYLVALDLANPAFDNEGAYALFAVGHAMCQLFSGGDTVAEVDDYSIESDNDAGDVFTASEVGDLVGAAVTYLCPAYLSEVQSYDAGM